MLTVRLQDISVIENLSTNELDVNKYLAPNGVGGVQWLPKFSSAPTISDKNLQAQVTVNDGDQAMASTISGTPVYDSFVMVEVNGKLVTVGDAVKTEECYFSNDGGTTARAIANISIGDTLHWVGSVAKYQLDANDRISLHYDI